MKSTFFLENADIYPIPVGTWFDAPEEDYVLMYAPWSDNAMIVTPDYVQKMEAWIKAPGSCTDEDINGAMLALSEKDPDKKAARLVSPNDFTRLAILPNNVCNFSCSYCYSAQGRSGKIIDKEILKKTLEHFIDSKRIQAPMLFIAILGGGEPLLSWDLVKFILEYGQTLADAHGFKTDFSLVTNGSVINDEIISVLKKYDVTVSVSFEILESIQNMQRGSYQIVSQNIKQLIDNGIIPKLRATITPENVLLQEQMIQEVISFYPKVKDIMTEAVTDAESFKNPQDFRDFYSQYIKYFFKAWKMGLEHDKNVECSASRNFNLLIERFCPGEFALTPDGLISMCTRITSPADPGFSESIYGFFDHDYKLNIDELQFQSLADDNVYSKEKCKYCFAKWQCGGGCMAWKYVYQPEALDEICVFTRNFTKRMILEKLDQQYLYESGISLKESVLSASGICE